MIVHTVSVAQPDLSYDVVHTVYLASPLPLSVEQPDFTRVCCTTFPSARRCLGTTSVIYSVDVLKRRDLYGHICMHVNVYSRPMYVKMVRLYVNTCRLLCLCVGMSVHVRPCPLYYAVVAPWPRSVTGH